MSIWADFPGWAGRKADRAHWMATRRFTRQRHLAEYFDGDEQHRLLAAVRQVIAAAPLYVPTMPNSGKPFSGKYFEIVLDTSLVKSLKVMSVALPRLEGSRWIP